jgi:hypothetical protein
MEAIWQDNQKERKKNMNRDIVGYEPFVRLGAFLGVLGLMAVWE